MTNCGPARIWRKQFSVLAALFTTVALAQVTGATVLPRDARIRTITYNPNHVIELLGFVGYQIHFQFGEGEEFVNLGTGDRDGIDVGKEGAHLFIKPRAARVGTNITVLTNRRVYHLHYTALARRPDPVRDEIVFSIRFRYPDDEERRLREREAQRMREIELELARKAPRPEQILAGASEIRAKNYHYEVCGAPAIRPIEVHDDGVQTRVRFAPRTEIPAIFVKLEEGGESLVNLNVENDTIVLHRIARQWVLRRGQQVACLRNTRFEGSGERLPSGTVHPQVERGTREPALRTP